jgi:hypothetical protein
MEKLESPEELASIAVDEVRLFMVAGLAAMTGLAALGLAEWKAARAQETAAREALQNAPPEAKAAADVAYQAAWRDRMDEEDNLTPAQEIALEEEARRRGESL